MAAPINPPKINMIQGMPETIAPNPLELGSLIYEVK